MFNLLYICKHVLILRTNNGKKHFQTFKKQLSWQLKSNLKNQTN